MMRSLRLVKMNTDTDTQYAFTRPITDHMLKHYDDGLKIDGEAGDKKAYGPRIYLSLSEAPLAQRVKQAVTELRGVGTALFKGNRQGKSWFQGCGLKVQGSGETVFL